MEPFHSPAVLPRGVEPRRVAFGGRPFTVNESV